VTAADVVVRGARVWTADPAAPWAEAVAVAGGRLAAVGTGAEAASLAGPGTRVIDLPPDRLVLPGFIDAHIHYLDGPLETAGVDLSNADTLDEVVGILEAADRSVAVVTGGGWRSHIFPDGPDRGILDRIFGDVPVLLREINSHSLWVNSAALAIAGVTAATPDPEPGFSVFARDARGRPTGWVLEMTAMDLVRDAVSPPRPDRARHELLAVQDGYAAAGLTGAFDAGVFTIGERDGWDLLTGLDREGRLGQRVVGSKVANTDPEDAVAILADARDRIRSPNVRFDTLKVFVDGVPEAHTSAYLEPYSDRPDTAGPLAAPEEQIHRWAAEAAAAGLNCHFHAIGDRAVRVALDAVEAARRRNVPDGIVFTICHGDLVDPADLPRFAGLGVVYNTSGQWIASTPVDEVMERRLGERARRHYRLRSALDLGTTVTLGSDFAASAYVSTYRPLLLIESAVTRRLAGVTGGDPLPPAGEAIPVAEALRAMTASAAAQLRIAGRTGSLRAGKDADLVVLGADLFRIPAHRIAATPVLLTMRAGRITHEAP
jgi:predicted amidohydrolase YtcJ